MTLLCSIAPASSHRVGSPPPSGGRLLPSSRRGHVVSKDEASSPAAQASGMPPGSSPGASSSGATLPVLAAPLMLATCAPRCCARGGSSPPRPSPPSLPLLPASPGAPPLPSAAPAAFVCRSSRRMLRRPAYYATAPAAPTLLLLHHRPLPLPPGLGAVRPRQQLLERCVPSSPRDAIKRRSVLLLPGRPVLPGPPTRESGRREAGGSRGEGLVQRRAGRV
jgi:hypothetical protein